MEVPIRRDAECVGHVTFVQLIQEVGARKASIPTYIDFIRDFLPRFVDQWQEHLSSAIGRMHVAIAQIQPYPMTGFPDHDPQWVVAVYSVVTVAFGSGLMAVDFMRNRIDVECDFGKTLAFVRSTNSAGC